MAYILVLAVWAAGWWINYRLAHSANSDTRVHSVAIPLIFGITLIAMWEILVTMLGVSPIILPPPSSIALRFAGSLPILWADFEQTILKGALTCPLAPSWPHCPSLEQRQCSSNGSAAIGIPKPPSSASWSSSQSS
jgi:hypothetical protein